MGAASIRLLWMAQVVLLTGAVLALRSEDRCSRFCTCDMWFGLRRAACTGRRLYSVQTGVPDIVQALDLSNNSVSALASFELARSGLKNLKYLNLSRNAISEIELNAFAGLKELTVLDLSRNHLYYILSDAFRGATSLRVLRLEENRFNSHVPMLRCSTLRDLDMSYCQISHINPGTFDEVRHLRKLNLSNNLMIQLDSRILQGLASLKNITLLGNPWPCDRGTYDLQTYLRGRNVAFEEVCQQTPSTKKFEKMISLVASQSSVDESSEEFEDESLDEWITEPQITTPSADVKKRPTNPRNGIVASFQEVSPYWFFGIGFILGGAVGIVVTYIWMSKTTPCCTLPRIRRRDGRARRVDASQRVSLLQNLWQHNVEGSASGIATPACPGTPPPPYREVMLNASLYPSAPTATLSGDRSARDEEPRL